MSSNHNTLLVSLLFLAVGAGDTWAQGLEPISAEDLLAMQSAVGGSRSPKWSPDGSKISFISGGRLVAVSPAGGAPVLLTDNLGLSGVGSLGAPQPTWSPDGNWVAYTSDKGGGPGHLALVCQGRSGHPLDKPLGPGEWPCVVAGRPLDRFCRRSLRQHGHLDGFSSRWGDAGPPVSKQLAAD